MTYSNVPKLTAVEHAASSDLETSGGDEYWC